MANSSLQRSRTAGSTKTKFTMSMWVKKSANNAKYLLVNYTDDSNRGLIQFGGSDEFLFQSKYSNSNNAVLSTNRKFRDTSGWYHFVLIGDSTLATAGDRLKLYVNGLRETSFASETQISQDGNFYLNEATTNGFRVGEKGDGSDFFDGYISHFVFLDGVVAAHTEFGTTDSTSGIWKFKAPSGLTFGTNGVHLKFENSANLGLDSSGNTNNMSVNGNLKQSPETPSNGYATWNFLSSPSNGNIGDVTGSNGNTTTSYLAQYRSYPATLGFKSGKWYWEVKRKTTSNDFHLGICSEKLTPANQATWVGNTPNGWVYTGDGGQTYHGGSTQNNYATLATDDIVGVAYDADNGKLYFSKNGTWQGSSNPATGANPAYSSLDTSLFYFPVITAGANSETNFGNGFFGTTAVTSNSGAGEQDDAGEGKFQYDVPAGYYAVNTKNINTYG